MKYILLIYGLLILSRAKGHVTRSIDTITEFIVTKQPLDGEISSAITKIGSNWETSSIPKAGENVGSNESSKVKVQSGKSRVYLEDVIYALKNQDWGEEEIPCLNQTLRLLRGLQNFTLWSVWNWDSISSQPTGLLYGNQYQLGNFDQCMNAPWSSTNQELRTQYCLAEIVLERTDHEVRRPAMDVKPYQSALDYIQYRPTNMRALNKITWGGCVPAVCTPRSVERLMLIMLARSHLGIAGLRPRISVSEPCQVRNKPRQYDKLFYGFIAMALVAVGAAITCTYWNVFKSDPDAKSLKKEIIESFCIRYNAQNLFTMKPDGAGVLYGIRFLTICFIVMDHQIGIFTSGPTSNGEQVDRDALSLVGMFVLHNDLFVDSFFLLSGFLTAMNFRKLKRFPNILLLCLKRYIRLIVAFGVVIFFYCAVFPFVGSGPLWNRAVVGETDNCRRNWWVSLLLVGNYVDTEHICIVVSWYIPCDFHFFVVATLVYWLYTKCPKAGIITAAILSVASILVPGMINYVNKLPAIQLFTYDFVQNPRASEQFHLEYIKSHTRFSSYIVGFFTGYIFTGFSKDNVKKISKTWSILGVCASLAVMTSVMCAGATYLWRQYSSVEGAVYAAMNRPLWTSAVAALVICCSLGCVPIVTRILTWYPFVPLSRLSYGIYLTHTMFITRNVYTTRNPQYMDYIAMLSLSLGVIVLSCIFSFIIWIFTEAPVNNLLTVLLKRRINPADFIDIKPAPEPIQTYKEPTTSFIQDNLPSTIYIVSSKI